ncbi:MAG: TonB-dependent receptor [Gammaproteobacteria bacterium]|nr:MAG: TonB-dependent receptor [Gammaproteobacteria bacterium]
MRSKSLNSQALSRHSGHQATAPTPQRTLLAQAVSAALIAGTTVAPLQAQELEEIVVTATKRAESVMDVPLAITAMTGDFVRLVNLDDVKDLVAFTPGVTGNTKDSFLDGISVRGIRTIDFGNGGDPSVSIYKNGLYQGRNGSAVVSLFDLERAEILRGPQGFLFGRNSVSGAMNIITAKPSTEGTSGYADLDVGERGHLVFEGAINTPVNDSFALRLSGYHSEEDGYVANLQGGDKLISHNKDAVRLSALVETDKWTTNFFIEYEDRNQSGTVYRATGRGDSFNVVQTRINGGNPIPISSDGRVVNNDNLIGSQDNGKITTTGLQIDYDMSFATISSITGYKTHKYNYIEDFDGSPIVLFNYGQDQKGDYFEQEFRLTSDGDGPLSWYAGASLYNEDIDTTFLGQQDEDAYCQAYWFDTCQGLFDYYNYLGYPYTYYLYYYFGSYTWTPSSAGGLINDRNRIKGKYRGYSTYVDLSYQFTDTFDVSVGVRYNYDEKDFSQESLPDPGGSLLAYRVQSGFQTLTGPLTDKQDWNKTTWRVVANWRPADNQLLFASIATGYKPGGFGSFNISPGFPGNLYGRYVADPATDKPASFGPETVTSYEIGYKGTVMGGRTQISANAFIYDYQDMQAIFGLGPIVIVDNIGQVDGTGVELEMNTALGDNFNVRFGGSWFDSEATNVQAFCGDGERITGDPDACEGSSIPWAPEWTAFAVLHATWPMGNGDLYGNLAWTWEDDYRADWAPPSVLLQQIKGINQTDLLLGYRTESWRVSAYVENMFNALWYDGGDDGGDPVNPYSEYNFGPARPRTYGMRFGYQF